MPADRVESRPDDIAGEVAHVAQHLRLDRRDLVLGLVQLQEAGFVGVLDLRRVFRIGNSVESEY